MAEPRVLPPRDRLSAWWQGESQREFTKLEFGLLGALFASIALNFILMMGSLFR